jgi:hypothetical protein
MGNIETSSPYKVENDNHIYDSDFWTVKKCSFNGYNKNAILYSYDDKTKPINYPLNQIKVNEEKKRVF